MQLPRFRFTLVQLIQVVAVLAVCFTVIRTPFGPLALWVGIILVGFAIDRARGGAGFRGGILVGVLCYLGLGSYQRLTHEFLFDAPAALTFGSTLFGLVLYAIAGAVSGLLISIPGWMVVSVNRSWSGEGPEDDDPDGPAVVERHDDGGASDR
jgi:hypothetical protein